MRPAKSPRAAPARSLRPTPTPLSLPAPTGSPTSLLPGWTNVDFLRDAMTSLGVRAVVQEYWQDMAAADRPNITKLMRTADGKGPAHAGFAM